MSFAFLNLGIAGATAAGLSANDAARRAVYPYFSHVVSGFGVNDLNGGTSAALQTSLAAIFQRFRPGTRITQCTITPDARPGTPETQRHLFNAALRAGTVPYVNNGYFEIANAVETAQDSDAWISGASDDLLHPNVTGNNDIVSFGGVALNRFWI